MSNLVLGCLFTVILHPSGSDVSRSVQTDSIPSQPFRWPVTVRPDTSLGFPRTLSRMPGPDAYARGMGFFCRQEWKLEKSVRMPLRFRLGNLEYVDRMEGKRR